MHILYDHLVAVLVAGIIFMVLVQVQLTGQQALVETTHHYTNRTKMISFVETVKQDFQNVGAGVDPSNQMIVSYTWNGTDKSIEFLARVDTTAGAPVELIKYQLLPVPTEESHCEEVSCYQVQRFVHDGAAYQPDGKSMNTLTDFEIELRTWNGTPVGVNLDETRQIVVRMAALSPKGLEEVVKQSRWQTLFRPMNLTRQGP